MYDVWLTLSFLLFCIVVITRTLCGLLGRVYVYICIRGWFDFVFWCFSAVLRCNLRVTCLASFCVHRYANLGPCIIASDRDSLGRVYAYRSVCSLVHFVMWRFCPVSFRSRVSCVTCLPAACDSLVRVYVYASVRSLVHTTPLLWWFCSALYMCT